jgi:hypothetical protein
MQVSDQTTAVVGDVEAPVSVRVDPIFTDEQISQDKKNRTARTAEQTFPAAFVVTIAAWILVLNHIDLDPGPGNGLPTGVEAAWTGLLTWLGAKWMNRR